MTRLLYSLVVTTLLPVAMLYLLWRARKQPEYRQHWGERFALYPRRADSAQAGAAPCIWLHAVSVGETRAAQPLINALRTAYPGHALLLTHTTPTGRATSEALYGDQAQRIYLPYDTPLAMRRFLRRYRPVVGVIMETELWPNLLHATQRSGIPTLLINARLSEKSAAGYARFTRLSRATLGCLQHIGAQASADADRLRELGARAVSVTGNLKFDITPPATQVALGRELRQRIGTRRVLLCASTREGEEAMILDAWRKQYPQVGAGNTAMAVTPAMAAIPLLLIVPRHPQRFDDVTRLARNTFSKVAQRSQMDELPADIAVLIGDSMGEMFAYYAAADVAFVGGSLLDFGCQNLIEPCALGTPVLIGPSTFNFADAAREALASGAARQIQSADELISVACGLLADDSARAALSRAGKQFAQAHRGATERTMALIAAALAEKTTRPAGR